MKTSRLVAALVTIGASALALVVSCGPVCVDDRCSLKPATPQTTRVDYTKPTSGSSTSVATGSAAPGSAAPTPGSAAPVVAAPPTTGSAAPVAAGSGSAVVAPRPPDPVPTSAAWEVYAGNQFKMYVISKGSVGANAKVNFEIVKTPTKTPFVITLEVGPGSPEGVWNDCPENKIVCVPAGLKTHTTKKAGQVLLQAGINWTVTSIADDAKGTLVTWTNNLSREVLSLRLLK